MDPRGVVSQVRSESESIVVTTSTEYDRAPRRVLWRADIGCTERGDLQCRVKCENEATVGICVLRRRGRLCHEVLGAPIQFGRFVYA